MKFTDQMGHTLDLPTFPQRIISLVPSQTELLFELGLADQVVGITKFCIHPETGVKNKQVVGGTKNFHLDLIRDLNPDLIIGNKEENYPEGILALQAEYPVWMSDISDLESALQMIRGIGAVTGTCLQADNLTQGIKGGFDNLQFQVSLSAAYFIWQDPLLTIGHNTFIHDMLTRARFQNVFGHLCRYPEITREDLAEADPQVIFLSSEPYPFREKHLQLFQQMCPGALIKLVDGEMFSWYGVRLRFTPAYLQQLRAGVETALGQAPLF